MGASQGHQLNVPMLESTANSRSPASPCTCQATARRVTGPCIPWVSQHRCTQEILGSRRILLSGPHVLCCYLNTSPPNTPVDFKIKVVLFNKRQSFQTTGAAKIMCCRKKGREESGIQTRTQTLPVYTPRKPAGTIRKENGLWKD